MRLLLLTALLALPAAAWADSQIQFLSPSGNIFCLGDYQTAYDSWERVACEIRDYQENIQPPQKRPSENECPLDWGGSFSLEPTGRAVVDCRGDTNRTTNAPMLAYGKTVYGKGWQCTSRQDGVLCQNRSGHGFHLSRIRQQLF